MATQPAEAAGQEDVQPHPKPAEASDDHPAPARLAVPAVTGGFLPSGFGRLRETTDPTAVTKAGSLRWSRSGAL